MRKISSRQWKGMLCALLGGTAWGFSGTCGQYIFSHSNMQADTITVIRLLGAGIILCLYNFLRENVKMRTIWKEPRDVLRLVLFAVIGLTSCQYAYLQAIRYSDSGTATVLQYCGIILIMLVSCVRNRRLPSVKEAAALIMVLLGVTALATHGRLGAFLSSTHGKLGVLAISRPALFWGGMAAIALMLYTLLPGYLLPKWGSTMITGYAMLIGGVVMGLLTRAWSASPDWSPSIIGATSAIVLLGTVIAFNLYLKGVELCGPVKASMIACVEPVAAALCTALWLGTTFTRMDIVGFVLIIGGVLLVSAAKE